MYEEEVEYKSEISKKTSNILDSFTPILGSLGLLIAVVSLFFGEWLLTLGLIVVIFVAAYISFKSHARLILIHDSMMTSLKWDYYEWDTYGRVRNILSKKLLTFLPIYVYAAVVLYFIAGLELNLQKLGLMGVFLAILSIQYSVIIGSDLNQDHHASEVKVVFAEALLIILGLVCVSICNFFITIEFVDILIATALIVTSSTLYLWARPLTPMAE